MMRRVAVLCLLLSATPAVLADVLTGRVVSIADGDTLTLVAANKRQHRIRLSAIDAPEQAQRFGDRSRTALNSLAYGKVVRAECGSRDQYGREVCKILLNGADINLLQLRSGMAWWQRKFAWEQSPADRAAYEQAEFQAKIRRVGLWADKNPVPPWKWRRQ